MPRPIEATIHLPALRHNLSVARQAVPDARVWAVLKADAYGHGVQRVFDAVRAADGLAVLDLSEAQTLRSLGWRGPVLLLEGVFEPRDLEWCSRLDLWHVVHHEAQIDWLAQHKTHQGHHVYLKLNSGMNRLGFKPDGFRTAWARLQALSQVDQISLMTHFSDADGPKGVAAQMDVYQSATEGLPAAHCVANSAAILRHAAQRGLPADWVRLGIALYGSAPDAPARSASAWGLQPTMSLRSQLLAIQHLEVGETVGYGSTFQAPSAMRVGVVACGYADGYPRHAGTEVGAPVLVQGVRTRTVGRVSMDMLTVDLTPVETAGHSPAVGDEVVLWGQGRDGAQLPVDEVAQAAGTIAYELMCALAPRVSVRVQALD